MAVPARIKTTGNVTLTDELSAFVSQKLERLEKLIDASDTTNLFEIELEETAVKDKNAAFRAEINFSSNGKVLRVEETGETMHAAIDGAVDEAARRLKHLKSKHTDLMRRGAARIKDFFRNFPGA